MLSTWRYSVWLRSTGPCNSVRGCARIVRHSSVAVYRCVPHDSKTSPRKASGSSHHHPRLFTTVLPSVPGIRVTRPRAPQRRNDAASSLVFPLHLLSVGCVDAAIARFCVARKCFTYEHATSSILLLMSPGSCPAFGDHQTSCCDPSSMSF